MTTLDFLSDLRQAGIIVALAPDGDQLKVSAPKGAIDETVRTALSARRSEILQFLQKASASSDDNLPPVVPCDGPAVLSSAQERVWQIQRLSPHDGSMNIAVPWDVRGTIDLDTLEEALRILAMRHVTLRSRFPEQDRRPRVVVAETATVELERFDVSHASDAVGSRAASDLATDFSARPFDLALGAIRTAAIRIDDDHHVVVFVLHQIVFDWGAAGPLVRDLSAIYNALRRGDEPELDILDVSYLDYAHWQRGWMNTSTIAAQERYWSEQLERPYRPLPLPTRGEIGPGDDGESHLRTFEISGPLTEQAKAFSRQSGATLYMTLLGAWQAVLAAYGDCDDAIVFTMLGQNRPELKKLVGLFANPLPIRIDLSGDPSTHEFLGRVRTASLGAYRNQDLPLEQVIERFRVDRADTGNGLFQALFTYQHEPTPPLQLEDASARLLTLGKHAAAFDLRLFAEETTDGVRGWLEYESGRIDDDAAERLLDQFVALITAMADRPEATLSELVPVTDADRTRVHRPASPSPTVTAHEAPRTELEEALADVWRGVFDHEVGIDDDFFALGGHSLSAVTMFTEIEEQFGRSLPLATLFEAPTIRQLASVIEQEDWRLGWTSLVPIKPSGTKPPIFCVAALGDEIIQFAELAELLSDDQPFYGLQQGLDRSHEIRTTIPEIAAHYLSEIRAVEPHGPYVIAGYCFGGLVAYEMAQQLHALGERVEPLLMIEAEAPGGIYPIRYSPGERVRRTARLVRAEGPTSVARRMRKRLGKLWRWKIWTRLRHHLHRGFDLLGLDLPVSLRDILQINAQAADDYAPRMVPYSGDIHVLRAEEMTPDFVYEDLLGWDRLVRGEIHSHWIPGDHEGIWKSPNVQVYAKQLERVLDEARRPDHADSAVHTL